MAENQIKEPSFRKSVILAIRIERARRDFLIKKYKGKLSKIIREFIDTL